jgi:hypothetical protein
MRSFSILIFVLWGISGCSNPEPWRVKMTGMLDSMVVLSKSHESVINSVDSTKVQQAYAEMSELQVFFLAQVDEMMEMGVPKIMFTGPLYKMENCVKYYGRVLGSYTSELTPEYNSMQLSRLLSVVESNTLDSALAIKYFNDEAFALRDANQRINKSYGACFECLREHDVLVAQLDSLKNFILATNAPN